MLVTVAFDGVVVSVGLALVCCLSLNVSVLRCRRASIESLSIPNSVVDVGEKFFYECKGLYSYIWCLISG